MPQHYDEMRWQLLPLGSPNKDLSLTKPQPLTALAPNRSICGGLSGKSSVCITVGIQPLRSSGSSGMISTPNDEMSSSMVESISSWNERLTARVPSNDGASKTGTLKSAL